MFKKVILVFLLILSTGCVFSKKTNQNDDLNRLRLTEKYYNKGDFVKINKEEFTNHKNETYVLYVYNNYCSLAIPCEDIFKSFMEKYNIDFLSMPFEEFKEIDLYNSIKYAPSVIIVNNGNIVSYLDANASSDLEKYQDSLAFEKWMNDYIYFSK